MASLSKDFRRAFRRVTDRGRRAVLDLSPDWATERFGKPVAYLDMLLSDHGIFRVFYLNRHRIGPKAWRAAQPAPHHLAEFARRGGRTVVNLRGERMCGSYWLETRSCEKLGLKLVNFQVRSRAAPNKRDLLAARDLFGSIEYPMLMHCKSGADRAGLMSALYKYVVEGLPIEKARRELALTYGHIRQAETGILDHFFETYLAYAKEHPIEFFDWVERVYDPEAVKASFRSKTWANRLVNGVLRRE